MRSQKWTGYSYAAFVVSVKHGAVSVCGQHPSSPEDVAGAVSIWDLGQELQAGRFEAVYVRRLVTPLTRAEVELVREIAATKSEAASLEAVNILQEATVERPGGLVCLECATSSVESFFTSRHVAEMLAQLGRVCESKHNSFSATQSHEHVLRPPTKLRGATDNAVSRRGLSQRRHSVRSDRFFTPIASPAAAQSPVSSPRAAPSAAPPAAMLLEQQAAFVAKPPATILEQQVAY